MILVSKDKIEEYTGKGWWGTTTLWDLFQRQRQQRPQAESVVDAFNRADFAHGTPQRLTWAQLGDAIDRFSHLLLETGIRRDDVLLMQLPNCVEQFVVYMGCARLGIMVTPVPTQYRENDVYAYRKTHRWPCQRRDVRADAATPSAPAPHPGLG